MQTLWRTTLVLLLASSLCVLAVQAAGADPTPGPRTLNGEEFLVQDVTMTLDCDPAGPSTVQFSASGPATGPYPGTFTAQGTVTIAPQTSPGPRPGTVAGSLTGLSETFTITSDLGTVTGVKKLRPRLPFSQSLGSCQHVSGFATGPVSAAEGTVVDIFSTPKYAATIQDSAGQARVRGDATFSTSELDLNGICIPDVQCHYRLAGFDQGFTGSTPVSGDDEDQESDLEEVEEDD